MNTGVDKVGTLKEFAEKLLNSPSYCGREPVLARGILYLLERLEKAESRVVELEEGMLG